MFSRQELIAELPRLAGVDSPPLESAEFGDRDFDPPSSEQSLRAFRGLKRDFANGLLFWVKTLQAQGWEGRESDYARYAEGGLCEPITESEFAALVSECGAALLQPLPEFLCGTDRFRSGLRMYADWNDMAAVAESDESFVAIYWWTSA